jgi:hypothetical protein
LARQAVFAVLLAAVIPLLLDVILRQLRGIPQEIVILFAMFVGGISRARFETAALALLIGTSIWPVILIPGGTPVNGVTVTVAAIAGFYSRELTGSVYIAGAELFRPVRVSRRKDALTQPPQVSRRPSAFTVLLVAGLAFHAFIRFCLDLVW